MKLNDLHYTKGTRKNAKRVARGPGSDLGKTAGRGHKGQLSRSGGYTKVGFEGGQMPLQRRIPKRGFNSAHRENVEIRLDELSKLSGQVDLATLKSEKLMPRTASSAKVISSGEMTSAVNLQGIRVSAGARRAIEAAGGSIVE